MTKKRIPTICEWALGFTVDDYVDAYERRRRELEGRPKQRERFRVEVSTDDESEEDSIKITYPRSGGSNEKPAEKKKVRFSKKLPKSALREPSASEVTTDTEDTSGTDSSAKNNDSEEESQEASDSSHADSPRESITLPNDLYRSVGHGILKWMVGKGKKKSKSKAEVSDLNTSTSETETDNEVVSQSQNKKGSSAKQNSGGSKDHSVDESTEDEDQKSNKKKNKKKKKGDSNVENQQEPKIVTETSKPNRSRMPKKSKETSPQPDPSDSDIGLRNEPAEDDTTAEASESVPEKKSKTKKRSKKSQPVSKVRTETSRPRHTRWPNLIMPVRAEVLQVEHAIEEIEDPRPNAFHDAQHNILRVYHGPVYGNPNGMLYPRRDLSRPALPVGTPHPLMNPYLYGFPDLANPGSFPFQGQSPWNHTHHPGMFGPPMMAVPIPAQENPAQAADGPASSPQTVAAQPAEPPTESPKLAEPAPSAEPSQTQDVPSGSETEKASSPQNDSPPDRPGTQDAEETSPRRTENRGWDSNIAPQNAFPINVNMYSYGGRPDPWSEAGRDRYARLNQCSYSSAERHRKSAMSPETRDFWDGSCKNNRGPVVYDRDAADRAAGPSRPGAVHPDLLWQPQPAQQQAPSLKNGVDNAGGDGWGNQSSPEVNNWGSSTSENNNWGNNDSWEPANLQWGASNPHENWGEAATGGNWTTGSNNSKHSSHNAEFRASSGTAAVPSEDPTAQKSDQGGQSNVKPVTMPGAWDTGVAAGNDISWDQPVSSVDNPWGNTSAAPVPADNPQW